MLPRVCFRLTCYGFGGSAIVFRLFNYLRIFLRLGDWKFGVGVFETGYFLKKTLWGIKMKGMRFFDEDGGDVEIGGGEVVRGGWVQVLGGDAGGGAAGVGDDLVDAGRGCGGVVVYPVFSEGELDGVGARVGGMCGLYVKFLRWDGGGWVLKFYRGIERGGEVCRVRVCGGEVLDGGEKGLRFLEGLLVERVRVCRGVNLGMDNIG